MKLFSREEEKDEEHLEAVFSQAKTKKLDMIECCKSNTKEMPKGKAIKKIQKKSFVKNISVIGP